MCQPINEFLSTCEHNTIYDNGISDIYYMLTGLDYDDDVHQKLKTLLKIRDILYKLILINKMYDIGDVTTLNYFLSFYQS